MNRRDFIKKTAIISVAAGAAEVSRAANLINTFPAGVPEDAAMRAEDSAQAPESRLIASAPMLQNYAETSIGIAFAVSDLANGYVLIGLQPDLSDAPRN